MTNIDTNKMYGVVDGVILCNMGRTQELSDRMFSRNVPSQVLQSQFSMRPVSTKYATMPIMDQRSQCKEPIQQVPVYNTKTQFNPGTAQSPWSGFATNVNVESDLRNQVFALQRSQQSVYIPSSHSDLYNETVQAKNNFDKPSNPTQQIDSGDPTQIMSDDHKLLFKESQFNLFNPNSCNLGSDIFQNHTRQQRMNLK
jgi:hypothetical protein